MNPHVLQAVAGIALLSFMDALIKGLVARLPLLEVTAMRYAVGSLAMVAIVAVARPGWPSAETLKANLARAVIVVVTATSFFYGLGQLPLAEALIISFVSPVFTALFAAVLLGERIDRRIAGALVAGFAGVLVIVGAGLGSHGGGPEPRSGSVAGVVAVLISAVGYSASNVLLRARAQRDPLLLIVLIQNVGPFAMLAAPAALVWTVPGGTDALLLVLVGGLGVSGHLLLARAYAGAEAVRLAPLDYTALLWAVVIGFAAFGEVPSPASLAGAGLILGAAALASRPRRRPRAEP